MAEDHITISNQPDGSYLLHCKHCGDSNRPALPISIDNFVKLMREFGDRHKRCTLRSTGVIESGVYSSDDNS